MRLSFNNKIKTGVGLASNSYKQILQSGEITLRELLIWASGRGFAWVELRDPEVNYQPAELVRIREFADKLDLRIHYAWDTEVIFGEKEVFERGIANAAVFGSGTYCRVVLSPKTCAGKGGYSDKEADELLEKVEDYTAQAETFGISLCFENSSETISGKGKNLLGMNELLTRFPKMLSVLDAANFTNKTTVINPSAAEVFAYYKRFTGRIPYVHLKSTKEHFLLNQIVADGDVNVLSLLDLITVNEKILVALELPQQSGWRQLTNSVEESLSYLMGTEITGIT